MSENINEKKEKCQSWYRDNKNLYEACGYNIKQLLETLLKQNSIPYHSIEYRIKSEKSFLDKCENDKYDDPITQITDVCGLRVISYTNHDVRSIQEIIQKELYIDEENSVDKSKKMKDNQVGYLSVHYIATFNSERIKLPEYKPYENIKFEIQVRTLLQHAWAEIEHDRNYKFGGELPSEIKRRFYLVAGSLELLDREFERLSEDIDKYAKVVRENAEKGRLDMPIDSTTLMEYLILKFGENENLEANFNGKDKQIISELQSFGINTLKDLDNIIKDEIVNSPSCKEIGRTYLGVLRDFMLIKDPNKYFQKAWKSGWKAIDRKNYEWIKSLNPEIEKYAHMIYIL